MRKYCNYICTRMTLLNEYKVWWTKQKIAHGDLWEYTDRLFCQWNGKNMASSTIRDWLNAIEERNNLKHVTPHGLRHSNITIMIDNGIDIKTVSTRARHAKVQTTVDNQYGHTSIFQKSGETITNIHYA